MQLCILFCITQLVVHYFLNQNVFGIKIVSPILVTRLQRLKIEKVLNEELTISGEQFSIDTFHF